MPPRNRRTAKRNANPPQAPRQFLPRTHQETVSVGLMIGTSRKRGSDGITHRTHYGPVGVFPLVNVQKEGRPCTMKSGRAEDWHALNFLMQQNHFNVRNTRGPSPGRRAMFDTRFLEISRPVRTHGAKPRPIKGKKLEKIIAGLPFLDMPKKWTPKETPKK
jgi:hypothetical protein